MLLAKIAVWCVGSERTQARVELLSHACIGSRRIHNFSSSMLLWRCLPQDLCCCSLLAPPQQGPACLVADTVQGLGAPDDTTFYVMCRGTLPPWSNLSKLETLDLTANSIEGTLPPDYTDLKQLRALLLSANRLHGCAHGMCMLLVRYVRGAWATCVLMQLIGWGSPLQTCARLHLHLVSQSSLHPEYTLCTSVCVVFRAALSQSFRILGLCPAKSCWCRSVH